MASKEPRNFRHYASFTLSALLGALIAFPISISSGSYYLIGVGIILGALIGYRRRTSEGFFFFVLIACGIMSSIILGAMGSSSPAP